jgi:hypothetical protein
LNDNYHASSHRRYARYEGPVSESRDSFLPDSRIPVEDVLIKESVMYLWQGAGNIVNADILGSMEYGCKVSARS